MPFCSDEFLTGSIEHWNLGHAMSEILRIPADQIFKRYYREHKESFYSGVLDNEYRRLYNSLEFSIVDGITIPISDDSDFEDDSD